MKEKKSDITVDKSKGSIFFHREEAMGDNDKNKPILQHLSKSAKKAGSHSLTQLQHFKTFHR
jgi:hypothetical protein